MREENSISRSRLVSLQGAITVAAAFVLAVFGGTLIGTDSNVSAYFVGFVGFIGYFLLAYIKPFMAFTILAFFALTVFLSSVKIFGNLSVLVGLGLVFSAAWFSRIAFQKASLIRVKEYSFLVGLSAIVLISAFYNLSNPAGFSVVPTYLQLYLLCILVVNVARTSSHLRTLGNIIILSSTITAALILLDQFGLLPQGLIAEQYAGVQSGTSFEIVTRTGGLWGDANFTAVQLTAALPFIIGEWRLVPDWRRRALLVTTAGTILVAFSLTLSIGGLVGLLALAFITAIRHSDRNVVQAVFRVILTLVIIAVVFYTLLPDFYVQRTLMKLSVITVAVSTQDSELVLQSASGRGDTWQAALGSIANSPLLGHGPGNASYENIKHSVLYGTAPMFGAHNMFLSVGADLGLIGLALFSVLLVSAILAVRQPSIADTKLWHTGNSLFLALVIYSVQSLALDIHNHKLLWLLLGMAIAYRRLNES